MKTYLVFSFPFLAGWPVTDFGQPEPANQAPAGRATANRSVHGTVYAAGGKPLAFASVALLSGKDSTLAKGGLTTESGTYELIGIAAGRYVVAVSMGAPTGHEQSLNLGRQRGNTGCIHSQFT